MDFETKREFVSFESLTDNDAAEDILKQRAAELQQFLRILKANDPQIPSVALRVSVILPEEMDQVEQVLASNTAVRTLDFRTVKMLDEEVRAIARAMFLNRTLTSFVLTNYGEGQNEHDLSFIHHCLKRNHDLAGQEKVNHCVQLLLEDDPSFVSISLRVDTIKRPDVNSIYDLLSRHPTVKRATFRWSIENSLQIVNDICGIEVVHEPYPKSFWAGGSRPTASAYRHTLTDFHCLQVRLRPELSSITLNGDVITDDEMYMLAETIQDYKFLTSIFVSSRSITNLGAIALADAIQPLTLLTSVTLAKTNLINEDVLERIAMYVERNIEAKRQNILGKFFTTVASIDPPRSVCLDVDRVSDEDFGKVVEVLSENRTITKLDLKQTPLSEQGVAALANMLKSNHVLKEIELGTLTKRGLACLYDALKVNTFVTVKSSSAKEIFLTSLFNKYLRMLKTNDSALTEIKLSGFSLAAIKTILEALKFNTTVQTLDMSNIGLSSGSADHIRCLDHFCLLWCLAQCLCVNLTITSISLVGNMITDPAIKELAALLATRHSLVVDVTSNPLSKKVSRQIKAVQRNNSLLFLVLEGRALLKMMLETDLGSIMPQVLHEVICLYADEGTTLEHTLKCEGVYSTCFNEQGHPHGERPNPRLLFFFSKRLWKASRLKLEQGRAIFLPFAT